MNHYFKIFVEAVVLWHIFMAPAWFARQNKKDAAANGRIRVASWLFGWTIAGWMWAMYHAFAPDKAV